MFGERLEEALENTRIPAGGYLDAPNVQVHDQELSARFDRIANLAHGLVDGER